MKRVYLILFIFFWGCGRTGGLPWSQDGDWQCKHDFGSWVGDGKLCDPCLFNKDCEGGYCLQHSYNKVRFCSKDCSYKRCPSGYNCLKISRPGGYIYQCVPQDLSCHWGE